MKRIVLILLLSISCLRIFPQQISEPTQYIFERISKDSGFTFSNITSIVSDKDNMIWFGCDNGLYYYNNNTFTHFKHDKDNDESIPSNNITELCYDSSDRLWVMTDIGLCYYDALNDRYIRQNFELKDSDNVALFMEYDKSRYLTTVNGKLHTLSFDNINTLEAVNCKIKSEVSTLYKDDDNTIYIGCESGELYTTDKELKNFKLIYSATKAKITSICKNYRLVYIGYLNKGVDVLSTRESNSNTTKYRLKSESADTQLPSNYVKAINKRRNGDIWIGTGGGLVVISPDSTRIIKANRHNNLSRNSIYSIHIDKNDAVWIGTWAGNVMYYNQSNYRFKSNLGNNTESTNPGNGMVYHFTPNDDQTTWVAGEWTGLSLHDHKRNKFVKQYGRNLHIKSICRDKSDNLWIGTIQQGLYLLESESKEITKIPTAFSNDIILSTITADNKTGLVWVGSRGCGLLAYNPKTKSSKVYNSNNTDNYIADEVWDLMVVGDKLLICSNNGFSVLDKDGKCHNYDFTNGSSSNHTAYSLCCQEGSNMVYVGTKENGVQRFNLDKGEFSDIEGNDIFKQHIIYNSIFDNKNRLWLSTNNGIYSYNTINDKIKHFSMVDGLNSLQFHPGSCTISPSGILYCGTTTGFNFIDTNQIKEDKVAPETFISEIYINNKPLNDASCKKINSKHYTNVNNIELSPTNNSITFYLTSSNALKTEKCQFKYRLKGYQDEWVYTRSNNAAYTKLPFGKYSLEIASCNSDGVWGDSNVVNVKIFAPIYLRWYAILLYIIIATLSCIYFMRQAAFKIKAKKDIEMERQINLINNKSFDEKVKFFMNISHELRTPLSLIKAPLSILEKEVTSPDSTMHINTIKRNTEQLLRLTNQILDFRLLEVGKLSAIRSKFDLVKLCEEILSLFEYHIKDRRINFTFEKSSESMPVLLDHDMISRTIYNLLSNALKYTEEEASITLSITAQVLAEGSIKSNISKGCNVTGSAIVISVEDNGCGIKQEQMQHIFERFYFNPNEAFSSSGIGLHMCMEYANLHQGNISVASKEGEGSKFTITIPTECAPINAETTIKSAPYQVGQTVEDNELSHDAKDQNKAKVLIIDDNAEIRFYLKKILGRTYNCITAKNGQQGYELAADVNPDIIILDVLMPVMGGVECAHKLRDNEATKHIPIIMLSGITDDNKVVQGVKAGADAYISKPINEQLLFTHIECLIARYNNTQEKVKENHNKPVAPSTNDNFVQRVEAIMEQHLQNNALDVNLIAELLLISRSTLHRSFKRELNMGVAEYIRDYRLSSAVKLMKSGVYNIDELSMCVGFNSSSYFCKAFKDKYNISPKKYYDSLQK